MQNKAVRVVCVVVTYNPEIEKLFDCLKSISDNSVNIVLVDNGSSKCDDFLSLKNEIPRLEVISLPDNAGIAEAQNIGIRKSFELSPDFIWLSDQDSVYPNDFISKMLVGVEGLDETRLDRLAAIGPAFYDTNTGCLQDAVVISPNFSRFKVEKGLNQASHIIASGMVIPIQAFKKVGMKNSELFIDWVDTEWCWRAKRKGLDIYIFGSVVMNHTLGDWFRPFFGKKVIIRSSFRHYFMVRNEIYLALYAKGLPLVARIEMILRGTARVLIIPFLVKDGKFRYLNNGVRGLCHGLIKKLGNP